MKNPTPANPARTDNLLFEHFATLATAPDGIARLRELILQLGVQGKLGTNNPTELPLKINEPKKRIRNVKSQDSDSSRTQIIDIFPPDSMPMNWRKTTLGSVGIWSTGGTPSRQVSNYFDGGIPWIKSGDLNDGIVTKTDETISQMGLDKSNAKLLPKGTISIALYGATIGKLGILGIEAATNQACANCVINEKIITTRYLFYFLRSQKSYFVQVGQGGAQPNITNWIIWEWPIVIPPLTEQHRIIEKIDRLMALCDELEVRQQTERVGCLKLGTASLAGLQNVESPEEFGRQWEQVCDAFDLILDCPENVVVLRQTILQLAVQGRLVRQEPGDEPAGKLVERIKAKKKQLANERESKAEKVLEPIRDDEIPFTISKQWLWDRLGSVLIKLQDGVHNSPVNISNGDFMYVTAKNIKPEGIQLSNITYISAKDHEDSYKRCDPKFGDVLLIKDGATTGIATINNLHQPFSMLSSVALLRTPQEILNKYLLYVLRSPFFYTFLREDMSGCAITRVTLTKLNRFIIPLPPLAEQHRIVAKVDALMALCDALEARLKERAGVQGLYAVAVVKGIA